MSAMQFRDVYQVRLSQTSLCCWLWIVSLAAMAGCNANSTNPADSALLKKYLLPEEPAGAIAIVEAKKLAADSEVVLVGKVGQQEPGKAMFIVNEALPGATGHAHKEGEDEGDCPFCKRSKADRVAMVQLLDEGGRVLTLAGTQLGLKEGQELIVKGRGQVDDLDMYVVSATGLYLKK